MHVIDSHTEGEPTRVILAGGPDLGSGSLAERRQKFADEFDHIRRGVILEPRGYDAMVGALLCEPTRDDCDAGVIFFNNAGYLGMCGHGMIGVAVTLAYLDRLAPGKIRVETPVGVVAVELTSANEATVENVPSYRYLSDVTVQVDGLGEITGDVAWGGNWFFLANETPCEIVLSNTNELTAAASKVRAALVNHGITGRNGQEIDHIEFFSAPKDPQAHSRNFVLCPGNEYDRSPCGTGTSAKLACLAQRGALKAGEPWVQESVIGSRFVTSYRTNDADELIARISGRAFICAESTLIWQPNDPFADGIV